MTCTTAAIEAPRTSPKLHPILPAAALIFPGFDPDVGTPMNDEVVVLEPDDIGSGVTVFSFVAVVGSTADDGVVVAVMTTTVVDVILPDSTDTTAVDEVGITVDVTSTTVGVVVAVVLGAEEDSAAVVVVVPEGWAAAVVVPAEVVVEPG